MPRREFSRLICAAVLVAAVAVRGNAQERWEADPEWRQREIERLRAYPLERLDVNPIATARAVTRARLQTASLVAGAWRNIGPFGFLTSGFYGSSPLNDGGRIRATAIHPTDPRILFAGSASGGVWRSTNAGSSWTPLTDNACSLANGAIAIDPIDPRIVYVGTGEGYSSNGCGLLRSVDGGDSWTEINGGGVLAPTNGTLTTGAFRLRVDRASAGSRTSTVLHYATTNGLHRSTNSGTTWSPAIGSAATDVVQDPATPTLWWAAVVGGTPGLYRSVNNGATWTLVQSFRSNVGRVALAVAPTAPGKVWMTEVINGRMDALRVYDNVSGVLTALPAQGLYNPALRLDFGAQGTYDLVLEIDPANAAVIYLAGSRIFRSQDGGNTFSVFAYDLHVDWHSLAMSPSDPNVMLAGNDGGVFLSTDRGNSWMSRNTNIATSQFYPGLGVHPTIPNVLAGGLQDNSSLWTFGSPFWTMSGATGDGMYGGFNEQNPNVFWSTSYAAGYVIRNSWSLASGLNSNYRGFTIPTGERKSFFTPLTVDPSNGNVVYYGTYRLWRTLDEGVTWTPLSTDLTKGSSNIAVISVSRADSRVIWVGTNDGNVQLSTDAGVTFTPVISGLPNRAVTDIAPDPTNVQRAVVVYSGPTGAGRVFLTNTQGASWTNVTGTLPDIPFNAAVILPGTPRILVAADVGVYASTDNGATWSIAATGLPNVRVMDLQFQAATGILYAATYGRGIWATVIVTGPGVLRGDVDRNGSVNAFDAALVQQALTGARPSVSQSPLPNGDANCNGVLDSGDVLAILQFAVGTGNGCVSTVR